MINQEYVTNINQQESFLSAVAHKSKVMVVDDQPWSLLHAADLISYEGYDVIKTNDSSEVISLASEQQPDVILMDVMMPEINGLDLAKQLKMHPQTLSTPILLMSVTIDNHLRDQALEIGVADILTKPLEKTTLYSKLKSLAQQKRLNQGLNQTQKVLLSLATAIENRSQEEKKSPLKLANLVMGFAHYLGLDDEQVQDLVFAAYLHDIGTVGVPEKILTKKGKLNKSEQETIRQHVIIGEQICQPLCERPDLLAIIRHHHERYDGSGYPDALQGNRIPYLAKVFQIVDIYHALTSKRSYKPAYSKQDSLGILSEETIRGWRDPFLFEQFEKFILSD